MEFIDLVLKYHVRDQNEALLQMVLESERDDVQGYAMKPSCNAAASRW